MCDLMQIPFRANELQQNTSPTGQQFIVYQTLKRNNRVWHPLSWMCGWWKKMLAFETLLHHGWLK